MSTIYKEGTYYGKGGGSDLPSGGTTGQVLAKHSNADGDAEWSDVQEIQVETLPIASADELGNIYQYVGVNTITTELLDSAITDFEKTGKSENCNIVDGNITLKAIGIGYGLASYTTPLTNQSTLKVTVRKNTGTCSYAGIWLGSTLGGNDLYQSSSWNSIPVGDTQEFIVDLSNYTDPIYLSFRITVVSGNTANFDITSVECMSPSPYINGTFYRCVNNDGIYSWEDTYAMTAEDLQDVKDAFVPSAGAPMRMLNYSTDEQIVGTWIDGKPIYQKTIIDNLANSINTAKYIDINSQVDFAQLLYSSVYLSDNSYQILNGVGISNIFSEFAKIAIYNNSHSTNPNSIYIITNNSNWIGRPVYITIQYTKTTD